MIAQELLKNIVLYNGIFNPYLQSFKKHILMCFSITFKHPDQVLLLSSSYINRKQTFIFLTRDS